MNTRQIDVNMVAKINQFEIQCENQHQQEMKKLQEIDKEMKKLQKIEKEIEIEMKTNREKQKEELAQIQMMIPNTQQTTQLNDIFNSQSNQIIEYRNGDQIIKNAN